MEIKKLENKVTEKVYSVIIISGDNGEEHGFYTDLEEAIKIAKDLKYKYFGKSDLEIHELVWNDDEGEYCYQYENSALIEPIDII